MYFLCAFRKKKRSEINDENAKTHTVLFCKEHKVPENECAICQPQLASQLEPGQSMKIKFSSKHSAQIAGVLTALPKEISAAPSFEAYCQLNYNGNKLSNITPFGSGVVSQVLVDVGSLVEEGEVLIEIHSAEIADAKANFLTSIVDYQIKNLNFKREEVLSSQKISSIQEYQEAEAASKIASLAKITARQKLLNYGFTEREIVEIEKTQDSSASLKIKAPYKGTILMRNAVVGEVAEINKTLFTLADLSTMWLDLSIPADKIAVVEERQIVKGYFDSLPGVIVEGNLSWIATSIDERSRMIKARAIVPNLSSKLKAGLFGEATIEMGKQAKTFRVPNNSIAYFENKPFLFIKVEDDLYELRSVTLGGKTNLEIDIIRGVQAKNQIVIEGAFVVMSEFLKSRLGAGCVDD